MRDFNYSKLPAYLFDYEIMNLISLIHEYKGKQDLYIEAKPDILSELLKVAKIQSTAASNRIEGIYTSDKRLNALMKDKAEPINRSEREIAGYREVLDLIHENYDYMQITVNIILQLHKELYKLNPLNEGGKFKNVDNVIEEVDMQGDKHVRFNPVSAFETNEAMQRLTSAYINAINESKYDPLLLTPMFILDFLCIHPFNDGNGRLSRLLTLLLLYRTGYIVGKYISIETIIEKRKIDYYDFLLESSNNWHEEDNNYLPFVKYYLEIIYEAYKEFSSRVEIVNDKTISKPERIRKLFDVTTSRLTKREILEKFPDISETTVEVSLKNLLTEEYIIKIGKGRSTSYIKNID